MLKKRGRPFLAAAKARAARTSSHIFYKIIHTDSTSVNVLLIYIFESRRERGEYIKYTEK